MKHTLIYRAIAAFFAIMLFSATAYAQRAQFDISELGIFPDDNAPANATVNCAPELCSIERTLIEANRKRQFYGYSVQIFFGSGSDAREKSEKAKKKFLELVDGEEAMVVYEQPYFKVRAGNFRTRLDATKLKKKIIGEFPGSFVVECKISYPKI